MQTQSKGTPESMPASTYQHNVYPDERGRFGEFGGKFVPESLMAALAELEAAYNRSLTDETFQAELREQLRTFVGRPTPLYHAPRFSALEMQCLDDWTANLLTKFWCFGAVKLDEV